MLLCYTLYGDVKFISIKLFSPEAFLSSSKLKKSKALLSSFCLRDLFYGGESNLCSKIYSSC